jgi:hypothetical protein
MAVHRRIVTAAVVLLLIGAAREGAAQGRGGGSQQQPVTTHGARSPQTPSPSAGSRFTSTLKFVPPPADVLPAPFPFTPFIGQGALTFGRFAFWPWGVWLPIAVYTSPAALEAPLLGAPVGGVQLDIDPRRAQVYVDGAYAGLVEEFSGYFHHLELPAGSHEIAIVAPGYEPLTLHVSVAPGATVAQRATLARAYGR